MTIGEAIKIVRSRVGIRQHELAQRAGLCQSQVSMIETNRRQPDMALVERMCKVMDVPSQLVVLLACELETRKEEYKPAIQKLSLAMLELLEAVKKERA